MSSITINKEGLHPRDPNDIDKVTRELDKIEVGVNDNDVRTTSTINETTTNTANIADLDARLIASHSAVRTALHDFTLLAGTESRVFLVATGIMQTVHLEDPATFPAESDGQTWRFICDNPRGAIVGGANSSWFTMDVPGTHHAILPGQAADITLVGGKWSVVRTGQNKLYKIIGGLLLYTVSLRDTLIINNASAVGSGFILPEITSAVVGFSCRIINVSSIGAYRITAHAPDMILSRGGVSEAPAVMTSPAYHGSVEITATIRPTVVPGGYAWHAIGGDGVAFEQAP